MDLRDVCGVVGWRLAVFEGLRADDVADACTQKSPLADVILDSGLGIEVKELDASTYNIR